MQLEHRRQKLLPFGRFLLRLARFAFYSFLLVGVSVSIGVVGYHHFGKLDWIDSFHMACMILTGMGPVADMTTDTAKIFSSFYALYSGVAFLTISAVFFAPIIHRILHILHIQQDDEGGSLPYE